MEAYENRLPHPFADFNEQGGGEWWFCLIARESNKELEIRILLDLLYGLFVGQAELVLNDHRADNYSSILAGLPWLDDSKLL